MPSLEQRLSALEHADGGDTRLVMVVRFVDPQGERPITGLRVGDHTYYRQDGETDSELQDRAAGDHKGVVLAFAVYGGEA